ncbi:MAG: hypothetical protein DMF70_16670 [Acidobacteria bacterium]|nr:MAG: hypothetical protein DMF70_16670 [Acidobacteriota bacterium]
MSAAELVDDFYAEGTETFTISLNNPSGATLGAQSTTTVTITDNDETNGVNPIDGTNFFVRQQYIDSDRERTEGRKQRAAGRSGGRFAIHSTERNLGLGYDLLQKSSVRGDLSPIFLHIFVISSSRC